MTFNLALLLAYFLARQNHAKRKRFIAQRRSALHFATAHALPEIIYFIQPAFLGFFFLAVPFDIAAAILPGSRPASSILEMPRACSAVVIGASAFICLD